MNFLVALVRSTCTAEFGADGLDSDICDIVWVVEVDTVPVPKEICTA